MSKHLTDDEQRKAAIKRRKKAAHDAALAEATAAQEAQHAEAAAAEQAASQKTADMTDAEIAEEAQRKGGAKRALIDVANLKKRATGARLSVDASSKELDAARAKKKKGNRSVKEVIKDLTRVSQHRLKQ